MENIIQVYKFRKGDIWQIGYTDVNGKYDVRPCIIIEDMKQKDHYANNSYILVCLISASDDYCKHFEINFVRLMNCVNSNILFNNIITVSPKHFVKLLGFVKNSDIDFILEKINDHIRKKCEDTDYIMMSDRSDLPDKVMKFFNNNFKFKDGDECDFKNFVKEFENYTGENHSKKILQHILNFNNIVCNQNTIMNFYKISEKNDNVVVKDHQKEIIKNATHVFNTICNLKADKIVDIFYNIIGKKFNNNGDFLHPYIINYDTNIHKILKQTIRALMMRKFINTITYSNIVKQKQIHSSDIIPVLKYGIEKYLANYDNELKQSA